MTVTVFLPGIMGSEMIHNNRKIWPPTLGDAVKGYDDVEELLDPGTKPGDIIEQVVCFDVYRPLLRMLRKTMSGETLVEFPYDWRQDLFDTAAKLADRLDQADDGGEIRLVAHSMGGLICRVLLESGDFDERPWFDRIRMLVTLATPHEGAPLALVRVLGLEGAASLSAEDTRRVASDPRYPSAYQLLPGPGEQAVWDLRTQGTELVDIYTDGVAELGLDAGLLAKAELLHQTLDLSKRPDHVRYFAFVATGHDTVTRVNLVATGSGPGRTEGDDAGDGTVPVWSASAGSVQKQVAAGEHSKFFRSEEVLFRLGDLLGRPPDVFARMRAMAANTLRLSVEKPVVDPAAGFVEVLVIPSKPVGEISGELVVSRVEDDSEMEIEATPLSYHGPQVSRLSVQLPLPEMPGAYRLTFRGSPPVDPGGRDAFAVMEPGD